mmetsp:Transcript_9304/g.38019  ORF Transcript_9304/g.38019 Transcript_9304/m.38019 type:complete len:301 (+) Transcript_9304:1159-2061(+)
MTAACSLDSAAPDFSSRSVAICSSAALKSFSIRSRSPTRRSTSTIAVCAASSSSLPASRSSSSASFADLHARSSLASRALTSATSAAAFSRRRSSACSAAVACRSADMNLWRSSARDRSAVLARSLYLAASPSISFAFSSRSLDRPRLASRAAMRPFCSEHFRSSSATASAFSRDARSSSRPAAFRAAFSAFLAASAWASALATASWPPWDLVICAWSLAAVAAFAAAALAVSWAFAAAKAEAASRRAASSALRVTCSGATEKDAPWVPTPSSRSVTWSFALRSPGVGLLADGTTPKSRW